MLVLKYVLTESSNTPSHSVVYTVFLRSPGGNNLRIFNCLGLLILAYIFLWINSQRHIVSGEDDMVTASIAYPANRTF